VWQYITLMKRVYLIDCPGVVPPGKETDEEKVLRGVVRVENVPQPADYIPGVLARVKERYLIRTYKVREWTSHEDFLEKLAKKSGKLLKGGEPDLNTVAKMVLNDWQRGKLPFFVPPIGCMQQPKTEDGEDDEDEGEVEDASSDQEEDEDNVEEEDEEVGSDVESTVTTDTVDSSKTVDSLHEIVKFPEDKETFVPPSVKKPKINLSELVKQDLKKIVTSVEYSDEDKYEFGKKKKGSKTKDNPSTETVNKKSEHPAAETIDVTTKKPTEIETDKSELHDEESKESCSNPSLKRKRDKDISDTSEDTSESCTKEVKTSSGTFSVTEES